MTTTASRVVSSETRVRSISWRPSAVPVYVAALALFAGVGVLLTGQMADGRDPALGAGFQQPLPPPQVTVRKVIITRRIIVPAPAPVRISAGGATVAAGGAVAGPAAVYGGSGAAPASAPAAGGGTPAPGAAPVTGGGTAPSAPAPAAAAPPPAAAPAPVAAAPAPAPVATATS